ncbi:hypothetical protein OH76DRAFT_586460 [Lentinus brumalis]|uniref:ARID domain-containing protein n=1 Tax=Lentinus brumalis TaxID=2498619 RepID=A0A371DTV8_9APHY|nr:hypothetical protein OH76DRAFT_586460 [Polyporus brumalis]
MAALQATSVAKAANRSAPGGTSAGYFGGMATNQSSSLSRPDDSHPFPPLSDPQAPNTPMNPPGPTNADQFRARKRSWLQGLANLMAQRGMPLPPQLTGVPFPPQYDPAQMPWKSLEVSPADLGVVRLAGVDVDLFRLWGAILQHGGGAAKGGWIVVRDHLGLPEYMPSPANPAETKPVHEVLERYYMALLGPFEEAYRKNMMENQQRAIAAGRGLPGRPGMVGGNSAPGMMPRPNTLPNINMDGPGVNGAINGAGLSLNKMQSGGLSNGSGDLEHDMDSRKRKMAEVAESEAKRVRQKTGGSDVSESRGSVAPGQTPEAAVPTITRTIRQPSRRKIEYVPLAPELDTAGGRNLDFIQNEWARVAARPLRHSDEWGHVDIDALTLSLRSRISTELSYSLTTFALLTLARNQGQHPRDPTRESGFPIAQAPELLDEAVELVEELAFEGVEEDGDFADDTPFMTHKELVNTLLDDGTKPFAGLQSGPGVKDASHGPRPRPADIVLTVVNIIRNISQGDESSAGHLAKHDKLIHVMLRLCSLAPRSKSSTPVPLSPILSISDLLTIRKDVVHMLVNFGAFVTLLPDGAATPPKQMQHTIKRAFEVVASFVVDPSETLTPFNYVVQSGIHLTPHNPKPPAPPSLANQALEAFARFTLPDDSRRAVAQIVPVPWIWRTFEALVHRLPISDHDFHAIMREPWIGYVERLVLCLYSLTFLSPPELKNRAKRDGALGFSKVVLRLLRKLTLHTPMESRSTFASLIRRAIELLKVVDDAEDSFDPSRSAMPTLSFGIGYGEHGDNRVERGRGMLCAYQEDITLGLMMHPEVVDAMLFSELESLVRVGP